jgi:putative membrane protein
MAAEDAGWPRTYLTGFAMGIADAVPGVSGGTIALIAGLYRRLIDALAAIEPALVWQSLGIVHPEHREDGLTALRSMDVPFLVVLLSGILTAVVLVTRIIHVTLEVAPAATYAFFVGLIAASALVLYQRVAIETPWEVLAAVTGFAVSFLASGSGGVPLGIGPAGTFLAGAIAVSAMVLPGISGSLLLIILGQYERMVETLQSFLEATLALASGGQLAPVIDHGTAIVFFVSGGVVGLFTVARSVDYALERSPGPTLAFLVSLVVGALRRPIVEVLGATTDPSSFAVAAIVGWVGLGGALVIAFDRYAGLPEFA